MELVCRRRDNCQKEASFGNYFLQLESSKNKDDRFSLHEDFMTCSCVCVCVFIPFHCKSFFLLERCLGHT